jgi:hypothetical protein
MTNEHTPPASEEIIKKPAEKIEAAEIKEYLIETLFAEIFFQYYLS